ncbi:MAG TPA: ABC transporter substrate-binding protein [Terriglobales bacterium]|nr:ABC transporter substrate-binding protein [Terriglobales bacterium]
MSQLRTTFLKTRGCGRGRARQRLATGLLLALLGPGGVVSASAASCLSSARAKSSSTPAQAYSRAEITDDLGRTFHFDAPPRRIVSLAPAYTETLFALGAGDRVVGVDDYSDYPPEAASRAKVGGGHHANLESIVALEPDLVVALVEEEDVDALAARGIPAIRILPSDFDGVFQSILSLGKVTGTGPCAQEIVTDMKARIARVEMRVQGLRRPRVFLELDGTDPARPFTSGPRSFIGAMVQTAGGSNIAHEIRTPSGQMSLEAIVAEDPQIIVLMDSSSPINPQSREDVLRRPGWSGISAVRNRAVVSVDSALFSRPSPRLVEGIEWLAHLLHPEAFP